MTTQAWTTRIRDDSDATYQEWRDELVLKFVAAGLGVDETNITAGAGSKPGVNTEGHYAVYHLADSLHGTAPIYIRVSFGTGANASEPRLAFTVGTSTNGSGTLGGTALTTTRFVMAGGGNQATDTARPSYLCVTDGFCGLYYKHGSGTAVASFFVARTVDTGGAISNLGAMVVWGSSSALAIATQALRFPATAIAYTARTVLPQTQLGFSPQIPSSTSVGSDIQAFLAWTISPQMSPLVGICGVLDGEVSLGTTFAMTPIGVTSRTYIALATTAGPFGADTAGGANPKFGMLWE